MTELVLASTSRSRKSLMDNAGLTFSCAAPELDERAIGDSMEREGQDPRAIALALAIAKAKDVSSRFPNAYVLGGDQTMALGNQMFHKPKDLDEARNHITSLQGKTHSLHSAVAIAKAGNVVWNHVASAHLTMRPLSETAINSYLEKAGTGIIYCVGAYQIESVGVTLFEKIDGDFFTIMGLPMLPILSALRNLEIIDA